MHEQAKLNETEYFLRGMQREKNEPDHFRYELSAFLSAARSVLQYACKEAESKQGGQKWYDQHMQDRVLRFFRKERNLDIHKRPTRSNAEYHVRVVDNVYVVDPLPPVTAQGDVVRMDPRSAGPDSLGSETVNVDYYFGNWQNGNSEVLALCRDYLIRLQTVVADGRAKGLLT